MLFNHWGFEISDKTAENVVAQTNLSHLVSTKLKNYELHVEIINVIYFVFAAIQ